MSTLLLRLAGPLQAWGTSSKFSTRSTGKEPTKSGVIGMIAAALGRKRDEPVDDLASLRYGVRIDQEGTVLRDYHTAKHPTIEKRKFITERMYLADAIFLVGLEGDKDTLSAIDAALKSPVYPLFLGRRSCPPSGRLSLGIRDSDLMTALTEEEWLASDWYARRESAEVSLDIFIDSDNEGYYQKDVPVSFSQERRLYSNRKISVHPFCVQKTNDRSRQRKMVTEHDPFSQIKGA